jgi:hypothetical protein
MELHPAPVLCDISKTCKNAALRPSLLASAAFKNSNQRNGLAEWRPQPACRLVNQIDQRAKADNTSPFRRAAAGGAAERREYALPY